MSVEKVYIEKFLSLQTEECLKFANKVSHTHAFYKNKTLNVKTVVQTLSRTAADTLQFFLDFKHSDFEGCDVVY